MMPFGNGLVYGLKLCLDRDLSASSEAIALRQSIKNVLQSNWISAADIFAPSR